MTDDDGVVSVASSMSVRERTEIDVQIATAKQFPRSYAEFHNAVKAMVTRNEAVADDCIYAVPRGRDTIEGPSARFAEILYAMYGNCRVSSRVVSVNTDTVVAQGVFHDLERNVAVSREVSRRIVDRDGRRYNADMIQMTGNAAASIAARNAVLAGIPRAVWEEYFKMAVNVVSGGNEQTLVKKRAAAMETVLKFGITHERLFARLEIKGPEEMMPEHLLRLRGLLNAIRDGDTTVDKAFPEVGSTAKPVEEEQQGQGMAGLKETLRKQSDCGSAAVIAVGGAAGASARPWMGRWTCLRPLKVPEDTTKPEKADAPSEPKPTYEAPARQMCAHTACMKESREGSLFCEDHGPAPAEKPKRKRKDDVPAAQD